MKTVTIFTSVLALAAMGISLPAGPSTLTHPVITPTPDPPFMATPSTFTQPVEPPSPDHRLLVDPSIFTRPAETSSPDPHILAQRPSTLTLLVITPTPDPRLLVRQIANPAPNPFTFIIANSAGVALTTQHVAGVFTHSTEAPLATIVGGVPPEGTMTDGAVETLLVPIGWSQRSHQSNRVNPTP